MPTLSCDREPKRALRSVTLWLVLGPALTLAGAIVPTRSSAQSDESVDERSDAEVEDEATEEQEGGTGIENADDDELYEPDQRGVTDNPPSYEPDQRGVTPVVPRQPPGEPADGEAQGGGDMMRREQDEDEAGTRFGGGEPLSEAENIDLVRTAAGEAGGSRPRFHVDLMGGFGLRAFDIGRGEHSMRPSQRGGAGGFGALRLGTRIEDFVFGPSIGVGGDSTSTTLEFGLNIQWYVAHFGPTSLALRGAVGAQTIIATADNLPSQMEVRPIGVAAELGMVFDLRLLPWLAFFAEVDGVWSHVWRGGIECEAGCEEGTYDVRESASGNSLGVRILLGASFRL